MRLKIFKIQKKKKKKKPLNLRKQRENIHKKDN